MEAVALAWTHASVSAFLFQGVRNGFVSGLSGQTLVAMTICPVLAVAKKLYFPVCDLLAGKSYTENTAWQLETAAWVVDVAISLGCVYLLFLRNTGEKAASKDRLSEDDFGRSHTRDIWFDMLRQRRYPPKHLHWYLLYLVTAVLTALAAWGQVGFSLSMLAAWASERPTAMMALYFNFLRGIGLLPQLHLSRRAGHVAPSLALWMAMKGTVDIIEVLLDGILYTDACYLIGDVIAFLCISDFMWIFLKSKIRGQSVVAIPTSLEV
jgi:hypothetical protein